MTKNDTVILINLERQEDGRYTVTYRQGYKVYKQKNLGMFYYGDINDSDKCRYFNIGFEVVSDYNPIEEIV